MNNHTRINNDFRIYLRPLKDISDNGAFIWGKSKQTTAAKLSTFIPDKKAEEYFDKIYAQGKQDYTFNFNQKYLVRFFSRTRTKSVKTANLLS